MIIPSSLLLFSMLFGGDKVVINEFSYDDSGTDDREFVEIYNPTNQAIDISGWKLDSNDQVGPNTAFTVPPNTTLAAGGYYVFGSAMVPNVDQVVGTTNIWENSQESLILLDADSNVIDSLTYEANKGTWPTAAPEGEGIWGNMTSVDGIETSWSRPRDGFDTNNNRDFRLQPATPGTTNDLPAGLYLDDFDARNVADALPDFGSSFAAARVIDPTQLDTTGHNPSIIPASPQGKNAAIFWDNAGGGNHNMLLRDPTNDVIVEAWVYFDAKLEPSGEREIWSFGVGTSGTYANFPDPSGNNGSTAAGNTGVAWVFEVDDTSATLYLVDYNDGGRGTAKTDRKVIGSTVLKAGVDDGWQRLRLEVSADTVTGYFSGSYGTTNTGTKITGTLEQPAIGGVYVSYREGLTNNATARPFTCDRMFVTPVPFTGVVDTTAGAAVKTTVGTPRVGTNGSPILGNSSFKFTGIGLVPSGSSIWALGFPHAAPIPLTVAGGQQCSFIYVNPVLTVRITADANGDAALPAPIPNSAALKGFKINLQILDIDPALPVSLKFGNSRMLEVTIG